MSEPEPSRLHMPTNMGMGGTLPPLSLPPLSLPPIKTDHLGLSPLGMPFPGYPQTFHSPNIASPSNHISSPQTPIMMGQQPVSPMGYANGGARQVSIKRRVNTAERYPPQQFQHQMYPPERPMEGQPFEPPLKQLKGIPGSPNVPPGGPTIPSPMQMRFNMDHSPGSSMNQSPIQNQPSTSQIPNGNGYPNIYHHLSPHHMSSGPISMMRPPQHPQQQLHYPPSPMAQTLVNHKMMDHRDMPSSSNGALLSAMSGPPSANMYHRPRMGYPEMGHPQQPYSQSKPPPGSPYKNDGVPPEMPAPFQQQQHQNLSQLPQMAPPSLPVPPGYPPMQTPPPSQGISHPPQSNLEGPKSQNMGETRPFNIPRIEPPVIPLKSEPARSEQQQKTAEAPVKTPAEPLPSVETPQPVTSAPSVTQPPPTITVESAQVTEAPHKTIITPPPSVERTPEQVAPPIQPLPEQRPTGQPQQPPQNLETVKALLERRLQQTEAGGPKPASQRLPPSALEQQNAARAQGHKNKMLEIQRRLQEPMNAPGQPVKLLAPSPMNGPNGLPIPPNFIQQRLQQAALIRPSSGQGQTIVGGRLLPPGASQQQILVQVGPKGQPVQVKTEQPPPTQQQQLSQEQLKQIIAERMKTAPPAAATPLPGIPRGLHPRIIHPFQFIPGQLHPSQAGLPVRNVLQAHQQLVANGRPTMGPILMNPHTHPGLAGVVVAAPRREPTASIQLAKLIDERLPHPTLSSKEQYRIYKKKFKYLVFENECYQEELRSLQRKLLKLTRDKNFLLDRLLNYEKLSDTSDEESDSSQKTIDDAPKPKKRIRPSRPKKEAQPNLMMRSVSGTPSPCPSPAPTTLLAQMLQPSTSGTKVPMNIFFPKHPEHHQPRAIEDKPRSPPEQHNPATAESDKQPPFQPIKDGHTRLNIASIPPEMLMPGPSTAAHPSINIASIIQPLSPTGTDTDEEEEPSAEPSDPEMDGDPPSDPQTEEAPSTSPPPPSPTHLNGIITSDPRLTEKTESPSPESKPVFMSTTGKIPDMFFRALKRKNEAIADSTNILQTNCKRSNSDIQDTASKELSTALPAEQLKKKIEPNSTNFSLFSLLTSPSWRESLRSEFGKGYMKKIEAFLEQEYKKGVKVFPPQPEIFSVFNLIDLKNIKIVIIGQDPYHDDNQAHGLSFSVKLGVRPPPSLKNMYKELADDIPGFIAPDHGYLLGWARQGVFMLNATLTVEAHKANSHAQIGWQTFTDHVIRLISTQAKHVVFLLWGGFAQKKAALIDTKKHAIVKTAHPSPLSARYWFGCKCFSKANRELVNFGMAPIDWNDLKKAY